MAFPAAGNLFERGAQLEVDDGVHDNPRGAGDFLQGALQLTGGTDQGVDVFDRQDVVETCADGAGQGVQGFARGIRHQVDVEVGRKAVGGRLRQGFRVLSRLWVV
jgi:hypothetical protein